MALTPITPTGQLLLCHNVPFTNSYEDTILFNSGESQIAYFNGKVKKRADNYSIITFGSVLRVPFEQDEIIDCNYLLFRNSNFNNKWFFAFITSIEFVNINMAHIMYEIDVLQTYMFDWKLGLSYIERSHTPTDLIGGNLVADDFNVNEVINADSKYVSYGVNNVGLFYVDDDEQSEDFKIADGIYSGYKFIYGTMPVPIFVNTKLKELNEKGYGDRVGCIFMFPSICGESQEDVYTTIEVPDNINGYVPKNKKLFSYPYCYVKADDGCGSSANFYFEYSYEANKSLQFTTVGKLATQPAVLTYVNEYNGVEKDYENAICSANFPICSYGLNGYQNYISQNKNTLAAQISAMESGVILATVGSVISGNPIPAIGAITGSLLSANSMMSKLSDKENVSQEARGQVLADGINMAIGRCGITFYLKTVPQYLAKIIDDRFTMYGYPIKKVEKININSRPNWNYIKTVKANISGNIGTAHLQLIKDIFNKGVTFWHTTDIGNYDLNNTI